MTATIGVVVPVLARPDRVAPLVRSWERARTVPQRLLFVCSDTDRDEVAAVRACEQADVLLVPGPPAPGDFARKVNRAYRETEEPWLFQAADDVEFYPDWDTEALAVAEQTGAGVVGTNDDANPTVVAGHHSTHSLIRRAYVAECGGSLDGPGVVFHEGYGHQWVDTELVELAKARGCYAHAHAAVVAHRHPFWHTATMDDTYRRGQSTSAADRRLYQQRRRAWVSGIL